MPKQCPRCKWVVKGLMALSLALLFRRHCQQCGARLRNSPLWMFLLSIFVVITTIASLGLINVFGPVGFALAGVIPVTVFIVGSWFVPLSCVNEEL